MYVVIPAELDRIRGACTLTCCLCHTHTQLSDDGGSAFNSKDHWALVDAHEGGLAGIDNHLPEANIFLCSRHLSEGIKMHGGGKAANTMYHQALKCNKERSLVKMEEQFPDALKAYVKQQKRKVKTAKLEVFPARARVRGNTTTNATEGTHAADSSARALPMDQATEEYGKLHGIRYNKNRALAASCTEKAPPKVVEIMDKMIEKATKLTGVIHYLDEANPRDAARVPTLNGKSVISRLGGDRRSDDVTCTCGYPAARGFPCMHAVYHAMQLGEDPYDLLHYKDTTAAWREQYRVDDPIDFPVITSDDYDFSNNDGDVPILQYPPVPPPKVGRPKKKGRIKSAMELYNERKRAVPLCSACGKAGHISTNRQCEMHPKNPAHSTNRGAGAGSRRDVRVDPQPDNAAQSERVGAASRSLARFQPRRQAGKRDRGSTGATASASEGQKQKRKR